MMQVQLVGNQLGSAMSMGGDGTLGSALSMGGDGTLGAAISMGGDGTLGTTDMMGLDQAGQPRVWPAIWGLASMASTAACAYHGYKRNNSVGWAIVWGLLGGILPVFSVAIAFAQGFGKPKA